MRGTFGKERRGSPFIGRSPRSRALAPPARPRRHEICASAPSSRGRVSLPCKKPSPQLPPPSLRDVKWRSARRAPQLRPIPPSRQNGPEHWHHPPASPSVPIYDIGTPPPPLLPLTQVAVPTGRVIDPRRRARAQLAASLHPRGVPGGRGKKTPSWPGSPAREPARSLPFPPRPLPQLLAALPSPHTQPPSPLPQWLRP